MNNMKIFNEIRIKVLDEIHDSGYNMLEVYGYKDNEKFYLGNHDVVNLEQENSSDMAIDSINPGSEFNLRVSGNLFVLIWDMESIKFRIMTYEESEILKNENVPLSIETWSEYQHWKRGI